MSPSQPQAAFDTAMQLGECPLWHPEQAVLYWIDIPGRAVHRLDPADGDHRSWPMPAEPGCIAHCAGGLVVALRTGLALLDTISGTLQHLADPPYDPLHLRFNDGRCDAAGRLWVGTVYEPRDRVLGSLFSIEPGSVVDHRKHVTVSNGVAFSPDNRTLYHADTTAHRITAYDYDLSSGTVGAGRLFHQFSTNKSVNYGGRPDGAAVDCEGAYWCAMYEGGRILKLSPAGEILAEIALPLRCPTMVAFGGADLRTLYITSGRFNRSPQELEVYPLSGHLLSMRVDVPGRIEPAYLLRD